MSTDTYDAARARIAELRALVEAGTPGPWEAGERCVWLPSRSPSRVHEVIVDGEAGDGGVLDPDDALLLTAAVNLLPAALDMAEGVLERHRYVDCGYVNCCTSCMCGVDTFPCPDATAVLRFLGIEDGA